MLESITRNIMPLNAFMAVVREIVFFLVGSALMVMAKALKEDYKLIRLFLLFAGLVVLTMVVIHFYLFVLPSI